MSLILAALAVWLAGGVLSLAVGRRARLASLVGPGYVLLGAALAIGPTIGVLAGGKTLAARFAWDVPLGSLSLGLDPLSALFAVAILAVSALAAVYGGSYLQAHAGRKNLGASWFFFNLLVASMLLVVIARNAVLFLTGWEMMSLTSFFLVIFENEKPQTRRAGWTYLVATHLGTALLLAMFALLGSRTESGNGDRGLSQFSLYRAQEEVADVRSPGSSRNPGEEPPKGGTTKALATATPRLDFSEFFSTEDRPLPRAGLIFLLALIGFGTKAGLAPLHVWLPEAHPAAPSHVSAVMSGVMIKTGIYGLLRVLTFLGPPPAWWGWTLVGLGAFSGIFGVLFALAQHDLKRLLAYHSVENIGIIVLGLGLGLLGMHYQNAPLAALAFAGSLLHVVNHAVFKSLLFLGAGSVLHATGTGEIEELGGLWKRMPVTGGAFLIGAAAICGLPPLNGFVSEWLIYAGALKGLVADLPIPAQIASIVGIGALALIGGLAAACFTKAFGVVFLGEPRSPHAEHAHEAGSAMCLPMVLLAAACLTIGLCGFRMPDLLRPAIEVLTASTMPAEVPTALAAGQASMESICLASAALLTLAGLLAIGRKRLLLGRSVERSGTWDCGYVAPTARMQYTASSFAAPITDFFRALVRTRKTVRTPESYFPEQAELQTETPDLFSENLYRPLFARIGQVASQFRWLQQGRIQLYVLYIALTLLVLLIWKLS